MAKAIVNKVQRTQQKELKEAEIEVNRCNVCTKHQENLYVCQFHQCPQKNRVVCKKCGKFTHDEDDDDYTHAFDVNSNWVQKVKIDFQNNAQNVQSIQDNVKTVQYIEETMHEQKVGTDRSKFELEVAYGGQFINTLQTVGDWVKNDKYFAQSFSKLAAAIKGKNLAAFSTEIKTVLFDVGDNMLEATNVAKEGAVIAGLVVFGLEFCYHSFKFINGDISLKTYGKRVMASAAMGIGAAVGNIGGSVVGGAIGTLLFPGVGTSIGSAIGGLLGAIFVGLKARQGVEEIPYFNEQNEQRIRHALIKEALDTFGFSADHVKKPAIFNEKQIGQRYRTRAKEAHPDRNGGSNEAFQKLNAQMSILIALLDQKEHVKEETCKQIKAITL